MKFPSAFLKSIFLFTKIILFSDFNLNQSLQEKIKKIILSNDYIKYSNWKWHEAGLPILRTRYVELVEYERNIFLPIAFFIG